MGKLTRKYDESLAAIQEMQQAGTAVHRVEDMEFGRRLAVERELELEDAEGRVPARWSNAVWDESGSFVIYASLLGIKGEWGLGIRVRGRRWEESADWACSCEYGDESRGEVVGQG